MSYRAYKKYSGSSKLGFFPFKAKLFPAAVLFCFLVFLIAAPAALAQETTLPPAHEISGGEEIAAVPGQAGLILSSGPDPRIIAAKIIRVALGFLGIVAVCLILYAGFLWMTSAGNEEQIGKAKKIMINAAIGMAIILAALGITQFIIRSLTAGLERPPLPPPPAAANRVGGGALGSGIIESHYPKRGERNVPRNARLIITFKQAVNPATIANTTAVDEQDRPKYFEARDVDGNGTIDTRTPVSGLTLRTDAIQIIKTADLEGSVRESDVDKYLGGEGSDKVVLVSFTNDLRTFVFTPVLRADHSARVLLGSADDPVAYTVYICGALNKRGNCQQGGVRLLNGAPAFQGYFKDYQWSFETGTFLDLTPPKITVVLPLPDNTADDGVCNTPPCRIDRPRNSMMQVNFDEPVLPTIASGITAVNEQGALQAETYRIMRVVSQMGDTAEFIAGQWEIGNQYQTSEFISDDLCARNSCGRDVFCLPGGAQIRGEALAATVLPAGGPASAGLFDGIEDIAGNSLDGNADGSAQGPGNLSVSTFYNRNDQSNTELGDNFRWSFYTSHELLLGAPEIIATMPEVTPGGPTLAEVSLNLISIIFNRSMAITTLNSRNINLAGVDATTGGIWDTWWTVESANMESANEEEGRQYPHGRTRAGIVHGGLWEQTDYTSAARSEITDLFQNCYFPSGQCGAGEMSPALPYCCNGAACAAGDEVCEECGFKISRL